jgi:hypothetical protein
MADWGTINERISECRALRDQKSTLQCLERLFETLNDGMVALALAKEYEKANRFKDAVAYYTKAETLFPLQKYKNNAREAAERLAQRLALAEDPGKKTDENPDKKTEVSLSDFDPVSTLFVVSCSVEKVWDRIPEASDYVPARQAYRGAKFMRFVRWIEDRGAEMKGYHWVVLGGKYGFTEPSHPICRYDVNLSDPATHPVSDGTLKNQTRQKRWWRNASGELVECLLQDFKHVVCVNCSRTYIEKIEMSFPSVKLVSINFAHGDTPLRD